MKGFTFSGENPPENLSEDGLSIGVGGLKWFPKGDFVKLNIRDLNFSPKRRGRKSQETLGIIPDNLTRRDCVRIVAEIFDPTGRITPLTASMKLDICELTIRQLDWDDPIPEDLREIWNSNFEMIQGMEELTCRRAVVQDDAISLGIETLDFADASTQLICVAVYARFKRKNGEYSCQLVFARSKVVPKNTSIPRAGLLAATINAATGHTVKISFGGYHKKCLKLTDSQIALYWINSTQSALKLSVRNRVLEINRLADKSMWRYIDSKHMIADIGTRKGAKSNDVTQNSAWISGMSWMRDNENNFPVKTAEEATLNNKDMNAVEQESTMPDTIHALP